MRTVDPVKNDLHRDEILSAARRLFCAHGLDMTTMQSIADAAGKSKATLYYYFKNKEAVLSALIARGRVRMMEVLENEVNRCGSAEERLRAFFRTRSAVINKRRELYPLIYKERKKHLELLYKLRRENTLQEAALLARILLEGVRSREFKSITGPDCAAIARIQIDSLQGRYLKQAFDGKRHADDEAESLVLDIFIRGIA